jgi:hypothetical protein
MQHHINPNAPIDLFCGEGAIPGVVHAIRREPHPFRLF